MGRKTGRALLTTLAVCAAVGTLLYFTKPAKSPHQAPVARPASSADQQARSSSPKIATVDQTQKKTHGPNDVVRSQGEAEPSVLKRPRVRFAARWNDAVDLSFKRLKEMRRAYLEASDFPQAVIEEMSGRAVRIRGAIMPIDPVPESGELRRFWITNPIVVMAGCVFCFPPTMGDLIYATTSGKPLSVGREQLYRSVLMATFLGRLELGPRKTDDGVMYMFGMEIKERLD